MSITRLSVGARLSGAVVHGDTALPRGAGRRRRHRGREGPDGADPQEVRRALSAAGSSKAKLLSATVWLANMGSYDEMNAVVGRVGGSQRQKPARGDGGGHWLANPKFLVEIAGVAAR